jgi:hypothetical protein
MKYQCVSSSYSSKRHSSPRSSGQVPRPQASDLPDAGKSCHCHERQFQTCRSLSLVLHYDFRGFDRSLLKFGLDGFNPAQNYWEIRDKIDPCLIITDLRGSGSIPWLNNSEPAHRASYGVRPMPWCPRWLIIGSHLCILISRLRFSRWNLAACSA